MLRTAPKLAASITYGHMAAMPRLPVPPLAQTMQLYLRTLRPLVSPDEYKENEKLVSDFVKPGGQGETLRNLLLKYREGELNWLEKWWDDSYLDIRDPNPVNVNYGLQLVTNKAESQTVIAAKLIAGAIDFKLKLDKEEVTPDSTKEGPLCMNQYARIFGHARIPQLQRDTLINYHRVPAGLPFPHYATTHIDLNPRHVLVLANGSFYTVDVLSADGKPYSAGQIQASLQAIVDGKPGAGKGGYAEDIGNLTAEDRDIWANARAGLLKSTNNTALLNAVDTALFVVALDGSSPANIEQVSESLLLGSSGARWFDKHQLIVFKNGEAGANFEHAPADGTTMLRLLSHASEYAKNCTMTSTSSAPPPSTCNCPKPIPGLPKWDVLTPELNDRDKAALAAANKHRAKLFQSFNTSVLAFNDFGGNRLKKHKTSPDAFAQVALQLAQFRLSGKLVATYESNSTRGFLHGRTETVRSASQEALDFANAMAPNSKASGSDRIAKLHAAVSAHQQYMKVSKNGEGVDRPLLGLRRMAALNNIELHPLFKHPAFSRSNTWRLSTSHLGGPCTKLFTFGPVVDDGYGIGYMIHGDNMCFNVTGWNHKSTPTPAKELTASLKKALVDMDELCASTPAPQ